MLGWMQIPWTSFQNTQRKPRSSLQSQLSHFNDLSYLLLTFFSGPMCKATYTYPEILNWFPGVIILPALFDRWACRNVIMRGKNRLVMNRTKACLQHWRGRPTTWKCDGSDVEGKTISQVLQPWDLQRWYWSAAYMLHILVCRFRDVF